MNFDNLKFGKIHQNRKMLREVLVTHQLCLFVLLNLAKMDNGRVQHHYVFFEQDVMLYENQKRLNQDKKEGQLY